MGFLLQWIILKETKYNDRFVSWLIDYVDWIDDIRSIWSVLEDVVGQIRNATDLNFVGHILFQPKIILRITCNICQSDNQWCDHSKLRRIQQGKNMSTYIFPT